jgi:hypothetical protein
MRRLLVALVALVVVPSAAGAITLTVTVTTASPITAAGVTLNGVDQTKTFTVASKVTYDDTSGAGANTLGWKVNVSATAPTVAGRSLPFLILTGVVAGACTPDTSGSCTRPTNNVTWPITINGTPAKIFNAAANTGQGSDVLTSTYKITYPANAIAGTYSSTITYAVASGP